MILQNFLFPKESICNEKELYFHADKKDVSVSEGKMTISKGGLVDFFSYFNAFSIEKWLRYTTAKDLFCCLEVSGDCHISLYQNRRDGEHVISECLASCRVLDRATQRVVLRIPNFCKQGICSVLLEAQGETCFYGGTFETDMVYLHDIHLVVGICTYQREEFVQKTLKTIREHFLADVSSPLADHLQVIVSDNGQTLETGQMHNCIHVLKNKNAGGTGGFARCMIEALTTFSSWSPTHILLMDDDVILEPEVLYRTFTFLSFLKGEYRDYSIGGALLRIDIPFIQHASGEIWNRDRILNEKKGFDVRDKKILLKNEEDSFISYNAWWYCCIPIYRNMKNFLPLPVFIHGDDIEFGLRKEGKFITLNGIGVWHDAFDNRKPSSAEYYDIRNAFLCALIHVPDYTARDMKRKALRHLMYQLLKYRYEDQELFLLGIQHVLQGVRFFKETDPVTLHAQIMKKGYHTEDCREELRKLGIYSFDNPSVAETLDLESGFRLWHIVSLNGWLLPGKRKITAIPVGAFPSVTARAKKVLYYEPETGMGFFTERKYSALFKTLKNYFKIRREIQKKFDFAASDIRQNWIELTTISFWKKYLEI